MIWGKKSINNWMDKNPGMKYPFINYVTARYVQYLHRITSYTPSYIIRTPEQMLVMFNLAPPLSLECFLEGTSERYHKEATAHCISRALIPTSIVMSEVFYRGKSPCGYDLPMYHVCNSCRTLIAGVLAITITLDVVFHEQGDHVSASSYDFV